MHRLSKIKIILSNSNDQLRTFGAPSKTWAVITGASDGIGKEFAFYLARAGYSTILISRTQSKLDAVASEIKSKYNTPTKTITIDFSSTNNDEDYTRLQSETSNLDIGILINNVGLSHSIPVPFVETPLKELTSIVNINCLSTLRMTQLITPGMIKRKKGLILTMGSFGGTYPTPLLATYTGSKAFLQYWSTALGAELAPHGITVELVQSYLVTSAMSKIRHTSMLIPNPRAFVRSTMSKIGRTGGAQGWMYTSTPFWSHAVMQYAIGKVGGPGSRVLVWYNKMIHEGIRKRALRKRERDLKAGKKVT